MYTGHSQKKIRTARRPPLSRRTRPAPGDRHILEEILSRPWVRPLLGWLSAMDGQGRSRLESWCLNYDNPAITGTERLRYWLPGKLIDYILWRYGIDKERAKRKLLHHVPTLRSLALAARGIARYGLSKPQRFPAPLMVVWNFTQLCNLKCRHCYQNSSAQRPDGELTLSEKLRVVDELASNGVPFLAIAGGEPLTSKDLEPVLAHASRRGLHLTLATNGTLLTPERVQRLIDCGVKYLEVSIDSPDPAEHDRFRGVPGAWERAIQGIRNSVAAGMRTGLATTFTRATVDKFDRIVQLAKDLGCATFSHFNFIPVGRGEQCVQYDLTPEQRELLLEKLVAVLQSGEINVISTAPQFGRSCVMHLPGDGIFSIGHAGTGAGRKTMVLARYVGGCGAGRCYCCVEPDGRVTPCVYMPTVVVGDLRRQSLSEIWDCETFRILADREDRGDHCAVCDLRVFCGGCRARALAYTGDLTAGDPGCRFNRHVWEEVTQAAGTALPVLQ